MTVQIELAAAEGIRAGKVDRGSWHAERQAEEVDDAFFKVKIASQVGDRTANVLVLGFALTVTAQRFQFFPKGRAAPLSVVYAELAIQDNFFESSFFSWGNDEFCFDLDRARHQRFIGIDRQAQKILDAAARHRRIYCDQMALFLRHVRDTS